FTFDNEGRFDRAASVKSIQGIGALAVINRVVVPGFYGSDAQGNIKLFPRGGSDRTGAILASTLRMTYGNWTDRPGIYTADPRTVPDAKVIEELSRAEVREGAHGGSGILQGDALIDLNGSEVLTIVRDTFNPELPGTRIVPKRKANVGESIVALS